MKDQVANLQKRNIKAIALTGGIKSDEMIDLLDNCQFGNYKFLYLSPERLQSDWIMENKKSAHKFNYHWRGPLCFAMGTWFSSSLFENFQQKRIFPKFLSCFNRNNTKSKRRHHQKLGLKNRNFWEIVCKEKYCLHGFEVEDKLFRIEQILRKTPNPP
jgi:ATP-dependent DNA helicase RecQ